MKHALIGWQVTFCAALLFALSASADTVDVNDVVSLTNALKNASDNSVIRLAKGVYDVSSLSADEAPMSTSGYGHSLLVLDKAGMKLVGATGKPEDVVIKAVNSAYRMFNLSGADSAIHNVTIRGGYAASAKISDNYRSGGAVCFLTDSASVSNCVFTDNKAAARGGAVAGMFNAKRGTVYNSVFYGNNSQTAGAMACDRTTVRGCMFSNNVATASTSGICIAANCNVYDSTFENNQAPYGCVNKDSLGSVVVGCRFLHNKSTSGSGSCARECVVSNSYFYGNSAPWSGGAIYGGTVSFCMVVSNRTENLDVSGKNTPYGGGIYKASLVEGSLIASNVCYNGGGVSDCTLVRNCTNVFNAAYSGGGAYNSVLEGCLLGHNVARGSGLSMNGGGAGGGLALGSATNCVFRDNSCSATCKAESLYGCEIADTSFGATTVESCVIHGLRNDPRLRAIGNVSYPEGHMASNLYMIGVGKLMRNCLVTNCTWLALKGNYVNSAMFYPLLDDALTSRVENCTFAANNYYYLSRYFSSGKALACVNTVFLAGETANELGDVRDFNKTGSRVVLSNCVYGVAMYGDVTKAEGFENSNCNPIGSIANARFRNSGEHPFAPGPRSPLRGVGLVMDWMADGVDLAGNPRLCNGVVDAGCYQYWPSGNGLLLLFR